MASGLNYILLMEFHLFAFFDRPYSTTLDVGPYATALHLPSVLLCSPFPISFQFVSSSSSPPSVKL
jgi:hypothetical protein